MDLLYWKNKAICRRSTTSLMRQDAAIKRFIGRKQQPSNDPENNSQYPPNRLLHAALLICLLLFSY